MCFQDYSSGQASPTSPRRSPLPSNVANNSSDRYDVQISPSSDSEARASPTHSPHDEEAISFIGALKIPVSTILTKFVTSGG